MRGAPSICLSNIRRGKAYKTKRRGYKNYIRIKKTLYKKSGRPSIRIKKEPAVPPLALEGKSGGDKNFVFAEFPKRDLSLQS